MDRGNKPVVSSRAFPGQLGASEKVPRSVGNKVRRRKPPKTAAVVISSRKEEFSYADALKKARECISLTELDINKPKIRVTRSEDRLIEISGPDGARLVDELASELKKVLKDEAFISRPFMKGEIRLFGLDDSVSGYEVAEVIADLGSCKPEEVKVGQIRPMFNGLRSVWVQCPLAAAVAVTSQPRVRIGWSTVRTELLKARPLQCFRCWEFGHVRRACKAEVDRSRSCFRCGKADHMARSCQEVPFCVLWSDRGRKSDHRLGSTACIAGDLQKAGPIPLARDIGRSGTLDRGASMEM